MTAMLTDHVAAVFGENIAPGFTLAFIVFTAARIIGRIAAPVFWFCVAEGCRKTRDINKYTLRMFVFAVVSHLPYAFAFYSGPYNVFSNQIWAKTSSIMWPLFLAVLFINLYQKKYLNAVLKNIFLFIFCLLSFASDWSFAGFAAPVFIYLHCGNKKKQMLDIECFGCAFALLMLLLGSESWFWGIFVFLSFPFLHFYNGERGKKNLKWMFYAFYPLHLMLLTAVGMAANIF